MSELRFQRAGLRAAGAAPLPGRAGPVRGRGPGRPSAMSDPLPLPTLASVVSPLSTDAFLAEVLHRRFELMPGPDDRFEGLFGWDDVNHLIRHGRLEPPLIRLVRNGDPVSPGRYSVQRRRKYAGEAAYREIIPQRLETQLREGATLVLSHLTECCPVLQRFARGLERELDTAVNINLYAGWRTDNGFSKHWDDHDVFILQLDGRKRWEVYPDTRPKPLKGDSAVERVPTRPLWTGLLTRGDVLYIPRGFWHVAYPLDEASLHLTTGLATCTGETVMKWLGGSLLASEHFRSDVPVLDGPAAVDRHLQALRAEIDRLLAPGAADDFLDWRGERAPRNLDADLPAAAASAEPPPPPARLETAVSRRLRVRGAPDSYYVSLRVNGGLRRFPAGARAMLEFLGAGGRATVDELAALCADPLSDADRRRIIRELLRQGVLRVAPGGSASTIAAPPPAGSAPPSRPDSLRGAS